MEESLTCKLKDNVPGKKLDKLFGTVCGYKVCDGVEGNATTGEFGAYSVCTPEQQLSYAMNLYYQQQSKKGNGQKACDFDGAATTQSSSSPSGTCSSLIDQAGTAGTGSVTSSPTGTADAMAASGSADASGSEGAAFVVSPGSVKIGFLHVGAYVATAMVAGAGMILL